MHQIFYIDVDEEVNSIIGKIKKSNSKYNILVIAQGALLMQSAVSLKLIKREIDSLDKKVMMIIRDERAASMAEKIGFPVKKSLEDVKGLNTQAVLKKTDIQANRELSRKESDSLDLSNIADKKNRLINLGSDSFISAGAIAERKRESDEIKNIKLSEKESVFDKFPEDNAGNDSFLEQQEIAFKNLFTKSPEQTMPENKDEFSTNRILKFLWIFAVVIVILIAGIGAYFFLPSAEVKVFPFNKNENLSLKLNVAEDSGSFGEQNSLINLKTEVIEKESMLSLNFDASGEKGDSNQKARGKMTIYNEFSEASQILVVTTRFLSNDNKLFRLLETVTVPGMAMKDGKMEPGKIEADIVADEAGEEFNIKEATFTIPGFKGSSKYEKFYAKLEQETKGGGSSGNGLKVVSKSDIESAKFKTEEQLKTQLRENIKNSLTEEKYLLDNAMAYEVVDFSVFPEEGSITENFEYQAKIKIKALVFSAKEMNEKITSFIKANSDQDKFSMELISFENNYGNADIDFSKKTIKMDVNVNAKLRSKIDADKISNSLAGKNRDELSDVVRNYPEISKVEAVISPSFLSNSFPRYPSRIKVTLSQD
ncbi:MAG: hypothetical protein UR66_C0004G0020 [Candidatus Moranbacteria bacterium GW2011_GWE1_35_17]|nr:MAG: hypothetical protein UR66_C0004G0020 [Candidatus Moranbacteria bacterium GW2011_GWE1_35_17]KKP69403.1 MAG: hypothetical protein UR65_C0051G0002 [Candidatus Moranbacteria bacterium GW2011_GWE2_35_164]KKP81895.1 MAG: hypothetical protein UR82_C0049G0005 [Candidatus Moranbacteria bacterium GW2011_GWF1_35_5]KKP85136.1 MAG: hypothetical protein UR83_C0004G0024 [Candidatus Moranbacteria bacterium GW2011_GWF2_35_54]